MKAFEIGTKKTILFYLHGLRGHACAQQAALQHMVKNLGVSVISLELPGHGKDSIEEHCMVPEYRNLTSMITQEIERRAKGAEQVILMGYSFGACLMILAADELDRSTDFSPKVAGLVGISTAFHVGHNVPKWQLFMANAIAPLSRFLFYKVPHYSYLLTISEMNVELISPDLQVQESIRNDDMVYKGRIPLNTSAQVYKAGVAATARINRCRFPVLLLHSADDEIALAPKQTSYGEHVKLKLFKKLRHNCIDGLTREVVVSRQTAIRFISDKL